jgi:hypothetical protein
MKDHIIPRPEAHWKACDSFSAQTEFGLDPGMRYMNGGAMNMRLASFHVLTLLILIALLAIALAPRVLVAPRC